MNKVELSGRLTADPVVRYTTDNKAVASFTLAVDRRIAKGQDEADFIRCQAWEKKAEFCEKYLRKGTKIMMVGRIRTGSYKDKDGRTVYTTDVIAEELEFAESKAASEGHQARQEYADPGDDSLEEEFPFK